MSSENSNVSKRGSRIQGQYECDICHVCFRTNLDLLHHKKLHVGVKPYLCGMCNEAFTELIEYKNHLKYHASDRHFNCKLCPTSFSSKSALLTHEMTHSKRKKRKARHSSEDSCDLKIHEKNSTGSKSRRKKPRFNVNNYRCKSCEKSFIIESEFHSHLLEHVNEIGLVCPICEETFDSDKALLSHKRVHFCSKAFLSKLAKIH